MAEEHGGVLPSQSQPKVTTQLLLLGCNAAIGGFMFGYDTGSMSGALLQLKRPRNSELNEACPGLEKHALSVTQQEIVVSSVVLGAFLSSMGAGWLSGTVGRRRALLIGSMLLTIGSAMMALAVSMESMVAARIVVGAGVGISSHTVPLYISECAPSSHRGRLCFVNDMMVVFGQVFAALISTYYFRQEVGNSWRYILGFGAFPGGLMFLGFFLQPESPRWLLSRHLREEAKYVLVLLRGASPHEPALEAEFQEMAEGVAAECKAADGNQSYYQSFYLDLRVRRALILGCGLQMLQQWSGINTIMYYGATIMQRSGPAYDVRSNTCFTDENKRDVASTIIFTTSQIVGVGVSWLLVDRIGRRPLLLTSLAGVVLSLASLGFVFHMNEPSKAAIVSLIVLYTVSFGVGLSPVPWTVNAEIYPVSVRGACISMSTSMNWFMNFLVTQTFLSWATGLSTYKTDSRTHPDGVFWLYSALAAVGMAALWARMPETRGVALEDMGKLFVAPGEFHRE
eukprot:TRINITY_DN74190_c0_g1_i1.p1 TRINITY_DN74190_c0_g1~~TRINITY_DN74190_c0_g1_i1.p1  ORF type:complete len:511 (+),score=79.13 TRINITY_DN74190_c0_g1_i1:49-1581(+)